MPVLIVAAGGGGDAITAATMAGVLEPHPPALLQPMVVLTYSWDRLMIDPLPGPRTRADFIGLAPFTPFISEVVASSRARPPAGSSLPRLAAELPVRLMLLDPAGGTVGLAEQIDSAATALGCDEIALVDVGGDVLTVGAADPGLRSPLADQLALAACVRTGIPTRLIVAGAGLDGELPDTTVNDRLHALAATDLPPLAAADAGTERTVFRWHPSEASGLLAAAAEGTRGVVEVRDSGSHVTLDDSTACISAVDARSAARMTPARHLIDAHSLAEVEQIVRQVAGVSEIDVERRKAAANRDRPRRRPTIAELPAIDEHARAASERGADHISTRRLAELVGASTLDAYAALSQLLTEHRPDRYRPSLYRVR